MLATLPEKPKITCRQEVLMLVHAYNCTRNNVTNFSLYYLKFVRKPCLPIDIIFATNTAELKGNTSTRYVENLKQRKKVGIQDNKEGCQERNRNKINDITIRKSDVHN